jgi:alkylation response protein AidB-like acyl-CoA dehydrogenase
MITFELSADQQMFKSTVREFARGEIRPESRAAEESGRIPQRLSDQYLELGLAALELPEACGGLGQGLVAKTLVEEELAYGDMGIALAMPAVGPYGAAVMALGTDEQKARLLSDLIARAQRGVIAWTELEPKPRSFSSAAEEQEDGRWRINGVKSEVVLGDEAGALIVFAEARLRDGSVRPAAFHVALNPVEIRQSGVRFGPRREGLGLNAAPVVDITFEDVLVEAEARLSGADDRFEASVAEMFTRIGLVAASRAVGLAQAAFDFARDFAQNREAFGKPIAHFQGLAFLLADMATRTEVMRAMVQRAAWAFDSGDADAPKHALMAIAECHEAAMFVTNNAVQVLGGAGFIQDYPVEKWMRDAKAHMAYALPHHLCDLIVGRLAIEGGPLTMEQDAPLPEIQPVLV